MKKNKHIFSLLVLVVCIGIAAGGYAGQRYVRQQIHKEAVKQAALVTDALVKQQAADRYTINHTGCAIRKIVAPQLASLDKARHDMTIAASSRKRANVTFKKVTRVLSVWTTIPPDFDCSTLPAQPPSTGPGH